MSTLVGGQLLDSYRDLHLKLAGTTWDFWRVSFLAGWLFRSMGILWLWWILRLPGIGKAEAKPG